MRCFKWRTAEDCDSDTGYDLRCSLRERSLALDENKVQVGPDDRFVGLHSPRSPGQKNQATYRNNNFCIYNISLDCPGEIVTLTSKSSEHSLSDNHTCQDYLWFDTSSNGQPQKICGDEIGSFSDHINTQSFIAVFWSNANTNKGSFEIEAHCSEHSVPTITPESSGDNPLISDE